MVRHDFAFLLSKILFAGASISTVLAETDELTIFLRILTA